jgi:hypothetical protein
MKKPSRAELLRELLLARLDELRNEGDWAGFSLSCVHKGVTLDKVTDIVVHEKLDILEIRGRLHDFNRGGSLFVSPHDADLALMWVSHRKQ